MNDSEQYKEHIEYTFAAFCKVVLRNASISAYRDIGKGRNGKYPLIISWKKNITIHLQQTAILRNKQVRRN